MKVAELRQRLGVTYEEDNCTRGTRVRDSLSNFQNTKCSKVHWL